MNRCPHPPMRGKGADTRLDAVSLEALQLHYVGVSRNFGNPEKTMSERFPKLDVASALAVARQGFSYQADSRREVLTASKQNSLVEVDL